MEKEAQIDDAAQSRRTAHNEETLKHDSATLGQGEQTSAEEGTHGSDGIQREGKATLGSRGEQEGGMSGGQQREGRRRETSQVRGDNQGGLIRNGFCDNNTRQPRQGTHLPHT